MSILIVTAHLLITGALESTPLKSVDKNSQTRFPVADYFFENQEYELALPKYKSHYDKNSDDLPLNYRIGICYLHSAQKDSALKYLLKVYDLDPVPFADDINYYLGMAHQFAGEYETAHTFYQIHQELGQHKKYFDDLEKRINECYTALHLTTDTSLKIVNPGTPINSKNPEYRPLVLNHEFYYTSRRKSVFFEPQDEDYKYYEDTYVTSFESNKNPKKVTKSTFTHVALSHLSSAGTAIVYNGEKGNGDLYLSKIKNGKLKRAKKIKAINTEYEESSGIINERGDTLYFISNREDLSIGKKDILYSVKNQKGKWGIPKSIGDHINTEYNEEGLSLSPDGDTLYFSSQGHNSIGGYDVFMSVKRADGTWSSPENLGMPINSPYNDVFFISVSPKEAYFSSDRSGTIGGFDVLMIIKEDKDVLSEKND